jgi:hypothetical protein
MDRLARMSCNDVGTHASGFLAFGTSFTETWTIGHPGDYTSEWQTFGGNMATTDFFLYAGGNQYGAQAQSVPELSADVLLATACITGFGYIGWRRRR